MVFETKKVKMNRAEQQKLVQETNMNLVAIRSAEIDYFSTFFSNFGTQAALIIGCIMGSVSQVPGIESNEPFFFIGMYWVTTAISLAGAMHVLLCTVFINVFGQGLALRGPLGSMVQAVEGMVIEQHQVLLSFIITTIFFGFNCIGMYWIMMDQKSAIAASVITLIGMYLWYHYCLRIYNRFNWNETAKDVWEEKTRGEDGLDDMADEPEPSAVLSDGRPVPLKNVVAADQVDDIKSQSTDAKLSSLLSPTLESELGVKTESGYLAMKVESSFVRRFFLLKNGALFYYMDQNVYRSDPSNPINRRPIVLRDYTLIPGGDLHSRQPPYKFTLQPADADDIRMPLEFQCDTSNEYTRWVNTIEALIDD